MCGIIGYKGGENASEIVIDSLEEHTRWAKPQNLNIICYKLIQVEIINIIDKHLYFGRITKRLRKKINSKLKNNKENQLKLKISRMTLSRILNLNDYWINLEKLEKITNSIGISKKELYNNVTDIKTKNSFPIKPIKLKKDETLARILGHIIADGGIHTIKNKHRVFYVNNRPELLNSFESDIKTIFGNVPIYKRIREEHGDEIWLFSTIGTIFYKILEYDIYNKKKIPDLIKTTKNKREISAFLQAIYDDDGFLYIKKKMIVLSLVNKELLKEIKDLVEKLNIKTNKIHTHNSRTRSKMFYFSITGKNNISNFYNRINFQHGIKNQKLIELVNSYG